jgi:hypothetical protein
MAATAGDERDWDEALAGIEATLRAGTARCRHRDHKIHLTPRGTWEDDDGLEVCVKAPPDQVGSGTRPDYIVHEPAPETP